MFKERVIAYNEWNTLTDNEKMILFSEVDKVLCKRADLWGRYSRGIDFETVGPIAYNEGDKLQILLEKFIVDLAAGYLSGKAQYDVEVPSDVQARVLKTVFKKEPITVEQAQELKYIVDTITQNNDDTIELTTLFRDMLLYGCCYERILDTNEDGYIYYSLDGLNTVAVWTNDVKPKLMAVVQAYETKEDHTTTSKYLYRVYLPKTIEIYSMATKSKDKDSKFKLEETVKHEWGRVPVVVYESQFSILDKCASVISAYETLLNNVRNTYKYNAEDCKMKIAGYRPQNPITIANPDYDPKDPEKAKLPPMIINPAREIEDEAVLAGKTFYVQEGGDADWLIKPVNANDVTTMLKFYLDTVFQLCGIPNTTDLAFNSADLNASAIDRKFYIMNIVTSNFREGMEKIIRSRLKMFLERINIKNKSAYDINSVRISINTNLPSMTDENIDQMLRLDGILSEETILEKLGYDFETESKRKEKELNATMARIGEENSSDDDEPVQGDDDDIGGTENTDTDIIRSNRKVQSPDKRNIQNNIQRENAKTVRPAKSISSPIGHETRTNK